MMFSKEYIENYFESDETFNSPLRDFEIEGWIEKGLITADEILDVLLKYLQKNTPISDQNVFNKHLRFNEARRQKINLNAWLIALPLFCKAARV